MTCEELEALAPELALGDVSGAERASALVHIESCRSCRDLVARLSSTVDQLAALAPPVEPPAGFEQGVLERIEREGRRARRRPRVIGAVAAAIAVLFLVAAGALWLRPDHTTTSEIASFSMRTPAGREVGEAYMHQGDSTWVFVDVPGWTPQVAPNGSQPVHYSLRVTTDDGRALVIPGDFESGGGGWGTKVDADAAHVRELALVDDTGHVWCAAPVKT